MTRGHPVLCGVFRRNDKPRVATKEREGERDAQENREREGEEKERRPARRHCGRKRGLYTYKAL